MSSCYEHLKNRNLCSGKEWPYSASDELCTEGKCKGLTWEIAGHIDIAEGDCEGIDLADDDGPVAVAIDAGKMQFYNSGIMKPGFGCKDNPNSLNHGVTIIGEFIAGQANPHWRIENSWGLRWGESGFFRALIGNTCGVCLVASYPIIKRVKPDF